jgi:hypothetical protein
MTGDSLGLRPARRAKMLPIRSTRSVQPARLAPTDKEAPRFVGQSPSRIPLVFGPLT